MRTFASFAGLACCPRLPARIALLPVGLVLLLTACTRLQPADLVAYDDATDRTTYRSRSVVLTQPLSTTGMTRSMQLTLTAQATCTGKQCTPGMVRLLIRINRLSDSRSSFLVNHSILLRFADQQLYWEDPERRATRLGIKSAEGVVTTFRVSRSTLEALAQADRVTGFFAGRRFVVPFRTLAPLRTFAQTITAPPPLPPPEQSNSAPAVRAVESGL